MMLFDTHAHLTDRAFCQDRQALVESLPGQGLGYILNPGCSLEDSRQAVALAEQYPFVYAAVGIHPDAADRADAAAIAQLKALSAHEKVKAIGEIGLDYHYEDIPRDIQKQAYLRQLDLARETGLPVIVHQRDAHEDGMAIIRDFPGVTGVFHCYSGSPEMACQLVELGFYIGFTGVITFKNARRALEVIQAIPRDRLVLETDCPYMAPEPFRGKRNHPGYLYRMAEKLSQLWQVSPEEAAAITLENGKRLYRI